MLTKIRATGIGLQNQYDVEFAERLNLFTGDNGLGKSFILDLAWWSLTGQWFSRQALPKPVEAQLSDASEETSSKPPEVQTPEIRATFSSETLFTQAEFDRPAQNWQLKKQAPQTADLVIYASIDGSFAVWDKLRAKLANHEIDQAPFWGPFPPQKIEPTYRFDNKTLWDGLRDRETGRVRCKGLLQDIVDWQSKPNGKDKSGLKYLLKVLKVLSCQDEQMELGEITRLFIDDVRDIPTIKFTYGEVPILLCSAAVQRIIALAYLLVWSWLEHKATANLLGEPTGTEMVLLIDEIELHLHPNWQRKILPSIMEVAKVLHPQLQTQVIATTHSPLVLASLEAYFNEDKDSLFLFSERTGSVQLNKLDFEKEGAVDSWLTSEVFGLKSAYSLEAQEAIKNAEDFLDGKSTLSKEAIEEHLKRHLSGMDPFFVRWNFYHRKAKA